MVFRLTTSAVDILVENASVADFQIGDDEARVGPFGANLDAGDDALNAAPTRSAIAKLLEAAHFSIFWRGLEARFSADLDRFDMGAQCRGRGDAKDVIDAVGATPVENLGAAVMTIGPQQYLGLRPIGADGAQEAAQKGADFLATGPFGGTQHSGDEALLLTELVTNAATHAYPKGVEGSVWVRLAMEGTDVVILSVRDAGSGLFNRPLCPRSSARLYFSNAKHGAASASLREHLQDTRNRLTSHRARLKPNRRVVVMDGGC